MLILKKLARGIERLWRVFQKLEKNVPHAKKFFICAIFANWAEKPRSRCSQPSRKENWGSISGLIEELLKIENVYNSVRHTVRTFQLKDGHGEKTLTC